MTPPRSGKESPIDERAEWGALPDESIIRVGIRGLAPGLLMHNPASMPLRQGTKPKTCSHGKGLDARCRGCLEGATYRNSEGKLCIPSVALHGALINASTSFKIDKKSAVPLISGILRVRPLEIPLVNPGAPFKTDIGELDYNIDTRWTVINRQRVIGHRPWIPEWSAEFGLLFDPAYIKDPNQLQEIVKAAGRRVGVLDFRPQHRGPFGTFVVEKWEEVSDAS